MSWIDELVADRPKVANKIGWAGEAEFYGASEDDRVGRQVRLRLLRKVGELHTAHPFARFTRRRGKAPGARFNTSVIEIGTERQVYSGETMLLNWSDGPSGATVSLLLEPGDGDPHPFFGCTRPSKSVTGTRFMAVFVEIDDDEQVVDQSKVERAISIRDESKPKVVEKQPNKPVHRPAHKHQYLSNAAALILKHPRFYDWVREFDDDTIKPDFESLDRWLKLKVGITSKSELDSDPAAAERFHIIRRQYAAWMDEQGFD